MIRKFGSHLIFMDFTNSIVKYNFPFGAMTVKDDSGYGFRVVCILTTSENEVMISAFVQHVLDKARVSPAFMIDENAAEIAALDGLHLQWHLCLFHMLQDWKQALEKRNEVSGKDNRLCLLRHMKALAKSHNETLFKHNEEI